jgi:hypothetical protein
MDSDTIGRPPCIPEQSTEIERRFSQRRRFFQQGVSFIYELSFQEMMHCLCVVIVMCERVADIFSILPPILVSRTELCTGKLGQTEAQRPPRPSSMPLRVSGGREAFARDGVCQHRGPRMRARLGRGLESGRGARWHVDTTVRGSRALCAESA